MELAEGKYSIWLLRMLKLKTKYNASTPRFRGASAEQRVQN
jgi:hypothetical protein